MKEKKSRYSLAAVVDQIRRNAERLDAPAGEEYVFRNSELIKQSVIESINHYCPHMDYDEFLNDGFFEIFSIPLTFEDAEDDATMIEIAIDGGKTFQEMIRGRNHTTFGDINLKYGQLIESTKFFLNFSCRFV